MEKLTTNSFSFKLSDSFRAEQEKITSHAFRCLIGNADLEDLEASIREAIERTEDPAKQIYKLAQELEEVYFSGLKDAINHENSCCFAEEFFMPYFYDIDFYEIAKELVRQYQAASDKKAA